MYVCTLRHLVTVEAFLCYNGKETEDIGLYLPSFKPESLTVFGGLKFWMVVRFRGLCFQVCCNLGNVDLCGVGESLRQVANQRVLDVLAASHRHKGNSPAGKKEAGQNRQNSQNAFLI